MSRKSKSEVHVQEDGPATMEVKIQHGDGAITTATYLLPDFLLAESVFEQVCNTARQLTDAATLLNGTQAYANIRPWNLPKRSETLNGKESRT